MKRQPLTWYEHALIAAGIPIVVLLLTWSFDAGLLASCITLIVFFAREKQQELEHKRRGDWDTPDADGITPKMDLFADMVGPWAVTLTWLLLKAAVLVIPA